MEKIARFSEMENVEQLMIVHAHKATYDHAGIVRSVELFMRCFNLGNPLCAISLEKQYARVEGKESIDVMRVIFRNYLI